jgi:hypothetical protein|tara:strand:+ start:406 stop:576 length:171 start_codon:yes stop_codon:yes gene_type:complete
MVGFMNDELKKLVQEYNQVLANQSDKCEITLASKITSLGYKMGYDTLEQIIEDYDE